MDAGNQAVFSFGGGRTCRLPLSGAVASRRLLEAPDELLWHHLHRPVKIDHGSLIVEADLCVAGREVHVAYKQYRPRNGWKSFCALFRRSRARRSWRLAQELVARAIPTAQPVALGESRTRWFAPRSYLATEWIESSENVHLFAWRIAGRPPSERLRLAARCAESLGRLVGRMHAEGISHRDLKAANLLIVPPRDPADVGTTETYLIDVDGMRVRRCLTSARRAANLARLAAGLEAHPWLTPSISCRFLRAYAAAFAPGTIAWKPLWRAVQRRTRRLIRRMRRRGEPVL